MIPLSSRQLVQHTTLIVPYTTRHHRGAGNSEMVLKNMIMLF